MEITILLIILMVLATALGAATWMYMELKRQDDSIYCTACGDIKPPPRRGGSVCDECALAGYGGTDYDD